MKRSEMFKIMLDSYTKDVPYHDDGGIQLMQKIDRMLTDIQEAGMSPPEYISYLDGTCSISDQPVKIRRQYQKWEEE